MAELYATDAASTEVEMGVAESPTEQTGAPIPSAAPRGPGRSPQRPAEPIVEGSRQVCPFCGSQNTPNSGACPRCTMEDTPATREATKTRIGPWFVLQTRNPAAPGMKFATLLSLVAKGHVTARSIVRGPTTHQLWRFGSQVRGLSREFGLCYSCGQAVEKTTSFCPHCERPQEPIGDPDVLLEQRDQPVPAAGSTTALARQTTVSRTRVDLDVSGSAGGSGAFPGRAAQRHSVVPIVPQPRPNGRIVSANDLAAALRDDPEVVGAPRSRRRAVLVTAAAVAGVIGVTFGYLQPDVVKDTARDARGWIAGHWQSARQQTQGTSANQNVPAAATADASDAAVAPAQAVPESPVMPHHSLASTPTPPASSLTPPQQSAPVAQAPPPVTPANNPSVANLPANTTANAVATASDLDKSRKLYDRAIDAESRSDWAEALRCYQAIQALPRSAWEADIVPRLSYARQMVSGR